LGGKEVLPWAATRKNGETGPYNRAKMALVGGGGKLEIEDHGGR
jgi:hypothetical protein